MGVSTDNIARGYQQVQRAIAVTQWEKRIQLMRCMSRFMRQPPRCNRRPPRPAEGCRKGNHGSDLLNRRPVIESSRAYLLLIALPRRLIN
jgi:hypothetical protein